MKSGSITSTQKQVEMWSSRPPQKVVHAESIQIFKAEVDGFLLGNGIKGYEQIRANGVELQISHDLK